MVVVIIAGLVIEGLLFHQGWCIIVGNKIIEVKLLLRGEVSG